MLLACWEYFNPLKELLCVVPGFPSHSSHHHQAQFHGSSMAEPAGSHSPYMSMCRHGQPPGLRPSLSPGLWAPKGLCTLSHNTPGVPMRVYVCVCVLGETMRRDRRSISFILLTEHQFSTIWDSDAHPWQNPPYKEYNEVGVWTNGPQAELPTPPLTSSMNINMEALWREGPPLRSYVTKWGTNG